MDPLDGNAIAGLLFDAFGREMTTAAGTCARCCAQRPGAVDPDDAERGALSDR
jgi:Family of unknown function (DUF6510)